MRIYGLIFAVLLAGIVIAFFTRGVSDQQIRERTPADWERQMKEIGPAAAYREFIRAYRDVPFVKQHGDAHLIGSLLYKVAGTDGLGICDESFAFGCYHAFFGAFISDKGTEHVAELAVACRNRFGDADTGCTHGIGHGILEVLGREHLLEALEICETSRQENPLYGCSSGVFMEYNDAIIVDERGVRSDVRQPASEDLREPCNTIVPEKFRSSCYFEIALWWRHLFGDDFTKIGNLCALIEEESHRNICYRGWGTTVAENSSYRVDNARRICGLIEESLGVAWCENGVALRFVGTGKLLTEAKVLCDSLRGEPADDCQRFVP